MGGRTWNFEFGPESHQALLPIPPANTADILSPGKLSSEAFALGEPVSFCPKKIPRIHQVPWQQLFSLGEPPVSQRAYFSAKTIVLEEPSGKERGIWALLSQTVS